MGTGTHLEPEEFHEALQKDENAIVLDIRNEFEYDIGHFKGATNLKTFTYSETWSAMEKALEDTEASTQTRTHKPIFMYCTGGIRCEKASAYLRAKGLNDVYQLKGGIHRYMEKYPDGGLFQGKEFVFDCRVSVPPSNSSIVVGTCIDCSCSHDNYAGDIACTVCRIPVLVCPACVSSNPYPNEYYCSRHREFKNIYFTVLERFSSEELSEQRSKLSTMLQALNVPRKFKMRRRTINRQLARINSRLSQLSADDFHSDELSAISKPKSNMGWGFWRA